MATPATPAVPAVPQLFGTGTAIEGGAEDEWIANLMVSCIALLKSQEDIFEYGKVSETSEYINSRVEWDIATNYDYRFEGRLGSTELPGRMHFHKENYPRGVGADHPATVLAWQGITAHDPSAEQLRRPHEKVLEFYETMGSFRQLARFVDPRQWNHNDAVEKNLREEKFRPAMLRILHHGGMVTADFKDPTLVASTIRIDRLQQLYAISRVLLEIEHKTVKPVRTRTQEGYVLNSNDPDYQKMLNLVLGPLLELEKIWADTCNTFYQLPTEPGPLARCQTFLNTSGPDTQTMRIMTFNSRPENRAPLLRRMLEIIDQGLAKLDMERLLIDMIVREDDFEKRLSVEHFEDKLIDKQVNVLDEEDMTHNLGHAIGNPAHDLEYITANMDRWESTIYRLLADMSLVNRQRRFFRARREWSYKRPWQQIYQIYDSSESSHAWVYRALQSFDQNQPIRTHAEEYIHWTVDDTYYTTTKRLFGFLPVDLAQIGTPTHPLCNPCASCQLPIEGNKDAASTVFELGCGHYFHMRCIFNFWDQPGRYTHMCPLCRRSPLVMNHQDLDVLFYMTRVTDGSEEFVHNNMRYPQTAAAYDIPQTISSAVYEQLTDAAKAAFNAMPQQRYWRIENAKVALLHRPLAIKWDDAYIPAGKRMTSDVLSTVNPVDLDPDDRVLYVRDIVTRRITLDFVRKMGMQDSAPPIDQDRFVPGLHLRRPTLEAAYMRRVRRQKNEHRRAQLRNQGLRGP